MFPLPDTSNPAIGKQHEEYKKIKSWFEDTE